MAIARDHEASVIEGLVCRRRCKSWEARASPVLSCIRGSAIFTNADGTRLKNIDEFVQTSEATRETAYLLECQTSQCHQDQTFLGRGEMGELLSATAIPHIHFAEAIGPYLVARLVGRSFQWSSHSKAAPVLSSGPWKVAIVYRLINSPGTSRKVCLQQTR
ncbi:uncharacterized protein LOC112350639 isoform X2 [Selaginella moellendorffii]|uniref:uncharacterized protein LOC112350639 isoform X2 n=1 Tax=Selaginella moellendorffii TaxID=88036 RepID=UPI000D1CD6FA|nr:uncharacterized protein LOC112350639 isoform X2 [Selaginella moellendorffii]XP_024542916.1 uncharacterized protein LOC112350639 isoform X2 [Selaginella moellendorffii]|eukprot:XP_024542915.1 uncharacterized protein LOC112350639 isoform X2 [Selaginella moellendorffii]